MRVEKVVIRLIEELYEDLQGWEAVGIHSVMQEGLGEERFAWGRSTTGSVWRSGRSSEVCLRGRRVCTASGTVRKWKGRRRNVVEADKRHREGSSRRCKREKWHC